MCYIKRQNELKNRMDYLNLVNAIINRQSESYMKKDIYDCVEENSNLATFKLEKNEIYAMIDNTVDYLYRIGNLSYNEGKFKRNF